MIFEVHRYAQIYATFSPQQMIFNNARITYFLYPQDVSTP